MSANWAAQGERSNRLALWTIAFIARYLGRGAARALLYPIIAYYLFAPSLRRHSRDYLRRVLPYPPRLWHIARHLHTFAATLLDRVFFLTGQFGLFDVRVHQPEAVLRYAAQKQGCLLLGSHLGSFEAMRCMATEHPELNIKILMHRQQSAMVMGIIESLNPTLAAAVIDTGQRDTNLILAVKEALDEGACIGLLGDRVYNDERGIRSSFLGGEAIFPTSPLTLASVLQVPVILCFGLYRGGNRYDLYFEVLAERLQIDRRARQTELRHWVQRYAERLEHYAREAPYNWFNFYDYWQEPAQDHGPDSDAATAHH